MRFASTNELQAFWKMVVKIGFVRWFVGFAIAITVGSPMAQLAFVPQVDPSPTFFQFTAVGANCPVPVGPIGHTGLSAQAFREEDIAIAQAFKTAQKVNQLYTHSPLVNSSLWATVQGRIVTIEGCVAGDVPLGYDHSFIRTQIETMVKAVPNVLRVEVLIRTGAQARAGLPVPYRIQP